MNRKIQPRYLLARRLVKAAGTVILSMQPQLTGSRLKRRLDPVTAADTASEKLIVAAIRDHFPYDTIVAEENSSRTGSNPGRVPGPGADGYAWHIDPLDGTVNYCHGFPSYCVSIGLIDQRTDAIEFGVVYAPYYRELFFARRRCGAFLIRGGGARQRLRVSKTVKPVRALLCTGFPYSCTPHHKPNLKELSHFIGRVQGVRRTGSAALDICYVAAGRLDGFWEPELRSWDVVAAACLVSEAGGLCTDYRGGPDFINQQQIVAAGPGLHRYLLKSLAHYR